MLFALDGTTNIVGVQRTSRVQQLRAESDRVSSMWIPNLGPLTRFSSLRRIRHFDVTNMRIPPSWMGTYTTRV
jgi:hypothetical protein